MYSSLITLGVISLLLLLKPSDSYRGYRSRIPNFDKVQHPCIEGEFWEGVGHKKQQGGGARNAFGQDFATMGNHQWTVELCNHDSDGDGMTNGEELGDPHCNWSVGEMPNRTTDITHPGVCTPYNDPKCVGKVDFLICKELTPPGDFICPQFNRTDVTPLDLTIPRSKVPNKQTTLMCYTFPTSPSTDFYLVGMEPLIDNKMIVHHMFVYGCPETTPITDEPVDCSMGSSCSDIVGLWTFGNNGFCLPNNTGFLFGPSGFKRLQIEFLWNNDGLLDGQFDASGMRFYFQDARPDFVQAGFLVTGNSLLQIPPRKKSHMERGSCASHCSSKFLTGDIFLAASLNHMHTIGVAQRTTLWRGDTKIRDLAIDEMASFDDPILHIYEEPIRFQPGDSIKTECEYDSTARNRTTYFGLGLNEEMCFVYVFFHPKSNMAMTHCSQQGPIQSCDRDEGKPIGECDWHSFVNGIVNQNLPIAQEVSLKCTNFGLCQPECLEVVERLKKHACMQEDMLLFISTRMQTNLKGLSFLAKYSSCANAKTEGSAGEKLWSSGILILITFIIASLGYAY